MQLIWEVCYFSLTYLMPLSPSTSNPTRTRCSAKAMCPYLTAEMSKQSFESNLDKGQKAFSVLQNH